MKYGFVGLGRLGGYLAENLIRAGFDVTIHDLDRKAADKHLRLGARWADTPRGAAANTDAVFTCLPTPAASLKVVSGPEGVFAGLTPGGIWIEMSTTDRDDIVRLAKEVAKSDIGVLEAPVTGGVHRAQAGEITVLVGGDEKLFKKVRPALSAMGGEIIHVGPLGAAAVIKVVTNMLAFIHLLAAGEALMLARRGGVDLGKAFAAIKASSGNSFVHETESQLILNGSYDVGFTMDLACKDLGFAMAFGREFGVPLALGELTDKIFRQGRETYGGGAWSTQIVKLLEDALGTDLRAPGFPSRLEI